MADNRIIIAILIIAGIFAAFLFFNQDTGSDSMISYKLYDAQGKVIPNTGFSVVNGVAGVASMDLGINVRNTGATPLTCNLGTLSPAAFNSAVTKTTKTIQPGQTGSWASGLISVAQFEALTQPVTFSAPVTCTYVSGTTITLPVQTGSMAFTITADAAGSFTVNVASNVGGAPTVCGNGICETGETTANCAADCVVTSSVNFRSKNTAINSAYPSGGGNEIAFSTTCGNTLTKAGELASYKSGSTNKLCANQMPSLNSAKIMDLPASKFSVGGYNKTVSLWKEQSTSSVTYFVCADSQTSTASSWVGFATTVATSISSSATSIDGTKEVAC